MPECFLLDLLPHYHPLLPVLDRPRRTFPRYVHPQTGLSVYRVTNFSSSRLPHTRHHVQIPLLSHLLGGRPSLFSWFTTGFAKMRQMPREAPYFLYLLDGDLFFPFSHYIICRTLFPHCDCPTHLRSCGIVLRFLPTYTPSFY